MDSVRAQAMPTARITRPYDRLGAQAQRYRIWALMHPACGPDGDDMFAEQMAMFYANGAGDHAPCISGSGPGFSDAASLGFRTGLEAPPLTDPELALASPSDR